jgi:hypothetical protein
MPMLEMWQKEYLRFATDEKEWTKPLAWTCWLSWWISNDGCSVMGPKEIPLNYPAARQIGVARSRSRAFVEKLIDSSAAIG